MAGSHNLGPLPVVNRYQSVPGGRVADLPRCRGLFIRCTKSIFVLAVVVVSSQCFM